MQDRSSQQDLPEEWSHGSHAARGPFSGSGVSDGYGAGTIGAHRARTADGFGTGPSDTYGVAKTDALGARTDSYSAGQTDAFGVRPTGTRNMGPADPFGPATATAFGPVAAEPETARPESGPTVVTIGKPTRRETSDARGFLGALFDFGFTSFVTPKVIRVLYMLIVIGTLLSALVFTIIAFKASATFGILTLIFGDPLFILIVLAIYRIILEFFAVTFRVAEDIRALRERGDLS